ncbi:MAG TPA: gliding motility protein GldL [Fermentimonas sp.]|nr:gliding motility protein GldL [Fermentimonas sp.]
MNAYKRYKNRFERFLQTERGKRFINFAYSIGAAIVILGAMFKILHFPFGNELLFVGMITEVIVFTLSAFDTPIRDYNWDKIFPALTSDNPEEQHQIHPQAMLPTTHASDDKVSMSSNINLSSHTEEYTKQMNNLNRTLSGLNSLYEIQLKSVSSQINSIEKINESLLNLSSIYGDKSPERSNIQTETEKMAKQLKELNEVYSRMLQAMSPAKDH